MCNYKTAYVWTVCIYESTTDKVAQWLAGWTINLPSTSLIRVLVVSSFLSTGRSRYGLIRIQQALLPPPTHQN